MLVEHVIRDDCGSLTNLISMDRVEDLSHNTKVDRIGVEKQQMLLGSKKDTRFKKIGFKTLGLQ